MRGGVLRFVVLTVALVVLALPALTAGAESAAWSPDELNWYGISQRRINETRVDAGLDVLAADSYLWSLAHERARDMLARDYLGPTTPEGLDAGAYMRKDGARYERWDEIRAQDGSGAPQEGVAWTVINNILNDAAGRKAVLGNFDRFGVALAEAGSRRVYVILLARSAPPAAAPAPARPPMTITQIITAAAERHGVNAAYLIRVARCESGLNPRAYNPAGPYIGLFQFHPATFRAYGGRDIYDPYDQSEIAARMFARGLAHHWGCA